MNEQSANLGKQPNSQKSSACLSPAMFDHEKLDVYHLELEFITWTTDLLSEVAGKTPGRIAEAADQLDRASLSALLNTAEGNGKRQRQVRAKFFDDARGSATECAACLDALVAKRAASKERVLEGKKILARIVSMLCGLVDRFDLPSQLRDGPLDVDLNVPVQSATYSLKKSRTRTRTRTRRSI